VTTPSDTGDAAAIQPPRTDAERPPEAPDLAAPLRQGDGEPGALSAAERGRMASLLQGARAAERQGKLEQCLERLREAAAVPSPPGTK
jgi:hypothetical protein